MIPVSRGYVKPWRCSTRSESIFELSHGAITAVQMRFKALTNHVISHYRWPAFTASVTFELFSKRLAQPSSSSSLLSWQSVLSPFRRAKVTDDHCASFEIYGCLAGYPRLRRCYRRTDAVSESFSSIASLRRRRKALAGPSRALYLGSVQRQGEGVNSGRLGGRVRSQLNAVHPLRSAGIAMRALFTRA